LLGKPVAGSPFGTPSRDWNNINTDFRDIVVSGEWNYLRIV
jgi:hypothetical protein